MIAAFGVAGTDSRTAAETAEQLLKHLQHQQDESHEAPTELTLLVLSAVVPVPAPTSSPTPVALSAGKIIPARETACGRIKEPAPK